MFFHVGKQCTSSRRMDIHNLSRRYKLIIKNFLTIHWVS